MTKGNNQRVFATGFEISSCLALMKPWKVQKGASGFQITGILYN